MATSPIPAVIFNPGLFLGRYPEFTTAYNANPALYLSFFAEAGFYMNNTSCSVVQDLNKLSLFLNMITAHIAFLAGQLSADQQTRPVGRVSAATEGAVSAQFEGVPPTPGTGAWFQQSQYGAAFWLRSAEQPAVPEPT